MKAQEPRKTVRFEIVSEEKKKLKAIDLTTFVRNQFKQLERRKLRIPITLFQL